MFRHVPGCSMFRVLSTALMKCILEKEIKPLCCSSLILKQTICLDIRGLYEQIYLETRPEVEIFFRDVDRSTTLQSRSGKLTKNYPELPCELTEKLTETAVRA